jgi:HPt (histidine-containing phosphotransfer) domain-containing protein
MPQRTTATKASEAPVTEPVLDLDHLRAFTEDDPQLERELSTLFLATAEMYLQQMQEALTGGRPWTAIAHALKGASANLGARRLAALALLAEASTPDRAQLDAIQHAVEELRALFAERVIG